MIPPSEKNALFAPPITRVGPGHSRGVSRLRSAARACVMQFDSHFGCERGFSAMPKDFKRTKRYRDLKSTMTENLQARGLTEPVYMDMLESYLGCVADEAEADALIAEQGLNIWDEKRGSWQINPAASARNNARRDKMKFFRALGFEAEALRPSSVGDDDDEL